MLDKVFPFDTVIVLSQSDWYTEMRSNRYHFTTRFSKLVPTFFVQNFTNKQNNLIEGIDGNITIVNPLHGYSYESIYLILKLARKGGAKKILFWIYSPYYLKFINRVLLPYSCIVHATEAYLDSDMINVSANAGMKKFIDLLKKTINQSAFVVSVSDGITEAQKSNKELSSPVYTVSNGCDYHFWNGFEILKNKRENAVLYQGGIHKKIDFSLLIYLANKNPSIAFWLCGESYFNNTFDQHQWNILIKLSNVTYFGKLSVEKVRELSHRAKVGIIPFKINDWLIKKAFPLKAFEYLSSGLEVISTPIEALRSYKEFFFLCSDYEDFNLNLHIALSSEKKYEEKRITLCKAQDYSIKFEQVLDLIHTNTHFYNNQYLRKTKKRVLFLYDMNSCHVNTVREHLNSFGLFSRHEITYYNATSNNTINQTFLNNFDVIALHYSLRLSVPGHISIDIYTKLKNYIGYKILFIQDEYDNLLSTYSYLDQVKFDAIFTCVPSKYLEYVYPSARYLGIRFINNLTGYVSYNLMNFKVPLIKDRSIDVFYRGRRLPYFYGTLGIEKYNIGVTFKKMAEQSNILLTVDIESDDYKRIYGDDWYRTLASSKATLATESGSNLFDFEGNLRELIDKDVKEGKSYEFIYKKFIEGPEKNIQMNQISPKLFEAICLKTVLILFEGNYSDVVKPYIHYIPLKKDFSNFSEVVSILKNDEKMQQIADKAYLDIVLNYKFSYEYFVNELFDNTIDEHVDLTRGEVYTNHSNLNFSKYLDQFFYKRNIVEKSMLGGAGPSILSEEYENILFEHKTFKATQIRAIIYSILRLLPENWIINFGKISRKMLSSYRKF